MRSETQQWVEDAAYDLQSAEAMFRSGRYFFVVFMCHLTVEKLLKAVIVENEGIEPPRIHSLVALEARAGVTAPSEHRALIDELDDKSVLTRYPDGRRRIASQLNAQTSKDVYQRTEAFSQWLKQQMNWPL
jgi:HEPN domain-containing protein